MTAKEFAALFNMTVSEMCEFTGFSRRGLNKIVKGNSSKDEQKKRNARHELLERTLDMLVEEQTAAQKRANMRIKEVNRVFGEI